MIELPPIELESVDIEPYRKGNTGVPFLTTFDSGKDGPHVMIMALTHGNELCGAISVDWLFKQDVRPLSGKLTLGFSNWRAYQSFDPQNPFTSRFVDEDINRVWDVATLEGDRITAETERARELRPVIDTVDMLLDIHSMTTFCPPLMICGPLQKGRDLASAIGIPEYIVSDKGHEAGKRMRDYGAFGIPSLGQNALLAECGQHWEKAAADVAHDIQLRFLGYCGSVADEFVNSNLCNTSLLHQKMVEVSGPYTIKANQPFKWKNEYTGFEVIENAGTLLGWDGDLEIKTPYDNCVLIMPNKLKGRGHSAVRFGRFIH
ncbi:MAG: succinylglutamate desuccinylase [Rhodospirillaceae bacterium TMED8]|nr:succinylglutamate desuccinylase [Magnetovibrio sp.]OUT49516.1 MAG: succinylglutamate desuccinylase [Rhodospirillaceae bacterium TMED8]|tara:strand:- start:492 stop:1445 length:954 start_codon:yes stop_codon:yes gene_type:complete